MTLTLHIPDDLAREARNQIQELDGVVSTFLLWEINRRRQSNNNRSQKHVSQDVKQLAQRATELAAEDVKNGATKNQAAKNFTRLREAILNAS